MQDLPYARWISTTPVLRRALGEWGMPFGKDKTRHRREQNILKIPKLIVACFGRSSGRRLISSTWRRRHRPRPGDPAPPPGASTPPAPTSASARPSSRRTTNWTASRACHLSAASRTTAARRPHGAAPSTANRSQPGGNELELEQDWLKVALELITSVFLLGFIFCRKNELENQSTSTRLTAARGMRFSSETAGQDPQQPVFARLPALTAWLREFGPLLRDHYPRREARSTPTAAPAPPTKTGLWRS